MKKMLGLLMYGGILFGLSAGGAWYMRSQHQQALLEVRKELKDPNAGMMPSSTDRPTVTHPNAGARKEDDETLRRVPIRPGSLTTVEEIVQYGMGLKERDDAIAVREDALQRVEAQYRMLQHDIESEQLEVEGLLAQARNQKLAAEDILKQAAARQQETAGLLKQVEKERREVTAERTKVEAKNTVSPSLAAEEDAERETNLKGITAMMESMSEDRGAQIIGDFMDDGKTALAVQLLSRLEDRKAAKILESLGQLEGGEDKATELVNRYAELKRPRRSAKR